MTFAVLAGLRFNQSGAQSTRPKRFTRVLRTESLETRLAMSADVTQDYSYLEMLINPGANRPPAIDAGRLDVNEDGFVSLLDANAVHDELLRFDNDAQFDVNGDGFVTPLDEITIVNFLAEDGSGQPVAVQRDHLALTTLPAMIPANDSTASKAASIPSTASPAFGPLVALTLVALDMQGQPIETIDVGSEFQIQFVIEDLRSDPQGVFAFYADMNYSQEMASRQAEFVPSDRYSSGASGDSSVAGLLDEFGGFSASLTPVGGGKMSLGSIKFKATAAGNFELTTNAADLIPNHYVLLYGTNNPADPDQVNYGGGMVKIPASRIAFTATDLKVEGEGDDQPSRWQNKSLPQDRDANGSVTPMDALIGINQLNKRGPGKLSAADAMQDGKAIFVDTNGDGFHTPLDELLVVNYINTHTGIKTASGEDNVTPIDSAAESQPQAVDELMATTRNFVAEEPPVSLPLENRNEDFSACPAIDTGMLLKVEAASPSVKPGDAVFQLLGIEADTLAREQVQQKLRPTGLHHQIAPRSKRGSTKAIGRTLGTGQELDEPSHSVSPQFPDSL